MKLIRFVAILISLFLCVGCSKYYEFDVREHHGLWSKKFVASPMPFSGASFKLEIQGHTDGVALISVYSSQIKGEKIKDMSVGPGKFIFILEEAEYWHKEIFVTYQSDDQILSSFIVKMQFD